MDGESRASASMGEAVQETGDELAVSERLKGTDDPNSSPTQEERELAEKREYNRRNAARARQRVKDQLADLSGKVEQYSSRNSQLEGENEELRRANDRLQEENNQLRQYVAQISTASPSLGLGESGRRLPAGSLDLGVNNPLASASQGRAFASEESKTSDRSTLNPILTSNHQFSAGTNAFLPAPVGGLSLQDLLVNFQSSGTVSLPNTLDTLSPNQNTQFLDPIQQQLLILHNLRNSNERGQPRSANPLQHQYAAADGSAAARSQDSVSPGASNTEGTAESRRKRRIG